MADCKPEIEVKAVFLVPAEVLYRVFTDERDLCRLTRAPAKFETRVGGEFSFFSGSVLGTVSRLDSGRSLTMQWRFSSWSVDSTVEISFRPIDSSTCELCVRQTGIPEKDKFGNVDQDRLCRVGWEERWIGGLASVLGLPLRK